MEWITIILSTLFTLLSPIGLVADQVAEGLIRDRVYQADLIDVRIDNTPNFRLVGGRVERVRFASRGIYPVPEIRIDTLDVETDPIDIDLPALQAGDFALDEPIQAAAHIVLTTEDLNVFLRSPRMQTLLNTLEFNLPGASDRERNRYGLSNPQVTFFTRQSRTHCDRSGRSRPAGTGGGAGGDGSATCGRASTRIAGAYHRD